MKPLCEICETRHYPYQSHVFAINKSQPAINKESGAINTLADAINSHPAPIEASMPKGGMQAMVDAIQGKTPNRRDREDYNRYMREYMRRKRSGFIGIAYG